MYLSIKISTLYSIYKEIFINLCLSENFIPNKILKLNYDIFHSPAHYYAFSWLLAPWTQVVWETICGSGLVLDNLEMKWWRSEESNHWVCGLLCIISVSWSSASSNVSKKKLKIKKNNNIKNPLVQKQEPLWRSDHVSRKTSKSQHLDWYENPSEKPSVPQNLWRSWTVYKAWIFNNQAMNQREHLQMLYLLLYLNGCDLQNRITDSKAEAVVWMKETRDTRWRGIVRRKMFWSYINVYGTYINVYN